MNAKRGSTTSVEGDTHPFRANMAARDAPASAMKRTTAPTASLTSMGSRGVIALHLNLWRIRMFLRRILAISRKDNITLSDVIEVRQEYKSLLFKCIALFSIFGVLSMVAVIFGSLTFQIWVGINYIIMVLLTNYMVDCAKRIYNKTAARAGYS